MFITHTCHLSMHCLLSFTFVTFLILWPLSPDALSLDIDPVLFVLGLHMQYTVEVVLLCMYIV